MVQRLSRMEQIRTMLELYGDLRPGELDLWVLALDPFQENVFEAFASWARRSPEKPTPSDLCKIMQSHKRDGSMHRVLQLVSIAWGFSEEALRGPDRTKKITEARHEAMYLMNKSGHSQPQIGRFLNRDASSVSHGVKRHQQRIGEKVEPLNNK